MAQDIDATRRLPLERVFGTEGADIYRALLAKRKARRESEEAEYQRMRRKYEAARRADWYAARAQGGPDDKPDDKQPPAHVETVPAVEAAPVEAGGAVELPVEAAPVEAAPDDDDDDDDDQEPVEARELAPPPDDDETIADRERWARKRIRRGLEGLAETIRAYDVWAPPAWVSKEVAKVGGAAIERTGVLDRAVSAAVAVAGFAGSVLLLWGLPGLFALRKWRDGVRPDAAAAPRVVDEAREVQS